jgi:hypothetical protein
MKSKIFLCLIIFAIANECLLAQDTTQIKETTDNQTGHNAWYFELGGASLIGLTLNYERALSKKPGGFNIRVGFGGGIIPGIFSADQAFGAIPVGLNYSIPISKDNRNFAEFGGTYSLLFSGDGSAGIFSTSVAWRFEKKPRGLITKIILIPLFYSVTDKMAAGPWFGIAIGKKF